MKKNIYILAFLSALVLGATSCIKETFPVGGSVTETQLQESDDPLGMKAGAITAALNTYNAAGYASGYGFHGDFGIPAVHIMTDSMLEDFVCCGNSGYNHFSTWASNRAQGETYIYCAYFWDAYYSWIFAANNVIKSISDPENADEDSKLALGQAYAYRAAFYLDLARMFEPKPVSESQYKDYTIPSSILGLTVPIVTETTTEEQAKNNPRAKRSEMYEFILSDLAQAEKYLAGTTSVLTPSEAMVDGLYARTYLELGYVSDTEYDASAFKKAQEYAEKAISVSGASALTQAQWEDVSTGFNSSSSQNSWLWGIPVVSESLSNLIQSTGWLSCEATWGYGSLVQFGTSKTTYEKINDNDFRKHSFLDPKKQAYYDYKLAGTSEEKAAFYEYTGKYAAIKFRCKNGEINDYVTGGVGDYPLMRMEEMEFIRMEALARQHNLTEATKVLNDFMKNRVTDGSYSFTASNEKAFIKEMLFQKRVEFWGEGILFFDYKRLNQGITRGYTGTNFPANARFNTVGRSPQWNIVITRGEFQSNTGVTEALNNPDPSGVITLWE